MALPRYCARFVAVLLFLIAVAGIVRGLRCRCNDRNKVQCVLVHLGGITCEHNCAIIYDRYRVATNDEPNPRLACIVSEACNSTNATHSTVCCNGYDFCNDDLTVPEFPTTLPPLTTEDPPTTNMVVAPVTDATGPRRGNSRLYFGLIIGLPTFVIVVVLFLLLVTFLYYVHLKKVMEQASRHPKWTVRHEVGLSVSIDFRGTIPGTEEATNSCSSGSGSGMPLLAQRTVARCIDVGDRIGSGRFGQVFVGEYQGEKVAIKKFVSHDDKSWARETEIYNTVYLINDNILGFFASDMVSNNGVTELWLITKYHPNGSLYDYLGREAVPPEVMLRMITSTCNGLSHLHTEVMGTRGKPAIAHRDIKSRNILVRQDLGCCIADFGLAVMKDANGLSLPTNPRQGTKRYMAPEVLNETMNMQQFESFKQADMYSLGLVVWEICRRCVLKDGVALDYELPFQGLVPSDPSFEDMKRLVVVERRQPDIPNEWQQDELLQRLTKVMQECWHFDGAARPTAANLKKRMARLSELRQDTVASIATPE